MTPDSLPANPLAARPPSLVWRYLLAIFTLEIGLFLVVFPWTDWWLFNNLQDTQAWLRDAWEDPYFKGAISGLGVVNVYLALVEFVSTLHQRQR